MARISLLDHQIDIIVQDFIETVIREQRTVSLYSIGALRADLQERNRQGYLLFPANEWDIKVPIDVDGHNENIKYLKKDMLAFNRTILDMSNQIERIKRNSSITKRYYNFLLEAVNTSIKAVSSSVLSDELVFVETFSSIDNIDDAKTTAFVNTELQTVELKNAATRDVIKTDDIDAESIAIQVSSSSLQSFHYLGDRRSIFTSNEAQRLDITGISTAKENVTATITFPLAGDRSPRNANFLSVRVANPKGMFARFYVSKNGIEFEPTTADAVAPLQGVFQSIHDKGPIRLIRIELIKSSEDSISNNVLNYSFNIEQVGFETKLFSDSAEVYSKAIQKSINNEVVEIGSVQLEVDDFVPADCKIKYEVSHDAASWRPIVPVNKEESSNNSVIFKSSATYVSDDIVPLNNHIWHDLAPIEKKGIAQLYNIFETGGAVNHDFCSLITNTDTGIKTNALTVQDAKVLPDTVVLRRGKGDWAAKSLAEGVTSTIRRIELKFMNTKNYESKIPLKVVEERRRSDINGVITTRFPIMTEMDVVVVLDGKKLDNDSVTSSNVTISGLSNQTVLVTYFTGLSDYQTLTGWTINLLDESIVVLDPVEETVISRNNFAIDLKGMTIKLRAGAKLSKDNLVDGEVNLRISYDYTITQNKEALVYETFVETSQPTTIRIFPFTTEEVEEYGNFHSIDGIDVSYNTSYVLQTGSHKILSTNPHKTDPNNRQDINLLSKKGSKAGIELKPEALKSMYAFELPQRQVSVFNLANTVRIGDDRSFAVLMVGNSAAVVLNRQPEEVPVKLLQNSGTSQMRGVKLLCKRAIYDTTGAFLRYDGVPETFTVSFQTLIQNEVPINKMYYKATLTRSSTNSGQSPFINTVRVRIIRG